MYGANDDMNHCEYNGSKGAKKSKVSIEKKIRPK